VLLAVWAGLYFARAALLPPVARFLDVSEPPFSVHDVMVLGGGSDTRPFIAAALVKAGKARQVLVPTVKPSLNAEQGIGPPEHEIICRVLRARGVPAAAIVQLPGAVASTANEARALAEFLDANPEHTVAVVTNTFHTRRARWIFQRTLGQRAGQVHFVAAPTDGFDENTWWQSEDGFHCYAQEYVKLGFHWLGR
jgi:uncharacterized SAM-binding protein YcdF (DUF218 family)